MKRFLIIAMVVLLAGCSKGDDEATTNNVEDEITKTDQTALAPFEGKYVASEIYGSGDGFYVLESCHGGDTAFQIVKAEGDSYEILQEGGSLVYI